MANETYFEATDGTTRLRCCGQPPGSSMCTCDVPVRSQADRQRNAAAKLRTTINRARETPKAQPAGYAEAVLEVSRQTGFGLRTSSTLLQLARGAAINPISSERESNLPEGYDPAGPPPDAYQAGIEKLRAAQEAKDQQRRRRVA